MYKIPYKLLSQLVFLGNFLSISQNYMSMQWNRSHLREWAIQKVIKIRSFYIHIYVIILIIFTIDKYYINNTGYQFYHLYRSIEPEVNDNLSIKETQAQIQTDVKLKTYLFWVCGNDSFA
jgi:hypothetical protein